MMCEPGALQPPPEPQPPALSPLAHPSLECPDARPLPPRPVEQLARDRAAGPHGRARERLLRRPARRPRALPAGRGRRGRPPRRGGQRRRLGADAEGRGPSDHVCGRPRGARGGAARRGLRRGLPGRTVGGGAARRSGPMSTARAPTTPSSPCPSGPSSPPTAGGPRSSATPRTTPRATARARARRGAAVAHEDPDRPARRARRHRARGARGGRAAARHAVGADRLAGRRAPPRGRGSGAAASTRRIAVRSRRASGASCPRVVRRLRARAVRRGARLPGAPQVGRARAVLGGGARDRLLTRTRCASARRPCSTASTGASRAAST